MPPIAAAFAGARSTIESIGSPASIVPVTSFAVSFASRARCSAFARASRRAMPEQVIDRNAEEVIGGHQADARRDDAVAVVVGVAAEGDVIAVLERDQALHREARRRVHADLAVPVDGHEPEGGVDLLADDA